MTGDGNELPEPAEDATEEVYVYLVCDSINLTTKLMQV